MENNKKETIAEKRGKYDLVNNQHVATVKKRRNKKRI